MTSEPTVDRDCGSCNACCVYPSIGDGDFNKLHGVVCPNWAASNGCTIYETRPGTCRSYFCGWRLMPQLGDDWRPDHSNIYINIMPWVPADQRDLLPPGPQCMVVTLLGELSSDHLAGLITLGQVLVQCEYPTVLMGAAPAGYIRKGLPLNYLLKPYLAKGDVAFAQAFRQILRACAEMPMSQASAA